MFTGHFAAALAGAGSARRLPLWLLIAAAFCGDLVEGGVATFNVDDPTRAWSHSIPATAAAGFALALGWRLTRGSWREASVLLLVAMSHTALDFVTAAKTVWPGVSPVGLGLYRYPYLDGAIEVVLSAGAWVLWRESVPDARRTSPAVRAMLIVLLVAQAAATVSLVAGGATPDRDGLSKFVR